RSSRRSSSAAVCRIILLLLGFSLCADAQDLADNYLPEAPLPVSHSVHAVMKDGSALQPATKRHRISLNSFSIAFLFAGEALDMWSTQNNLTHPRWICGYGPAFGNAVTYISNDGRQYDAQTIQNELCGPGPSGQLANYAYDVTRTGAFTEDGWVTRLH